MIFFFLLFKAEESDRRRKRWNLAYALGISYRRLDIQYREERNGHGKQERQHDELYRFRWLRESWKSLSEGGRKGVKDMGENERERDK